MVIIVSKLKYYKNKLCFLTYLCNLGFKFSFMLYDEEFFPIGRVRLISDMEIPFQSLDEVDRITQFVANLLVTYKYVKESYDILNEVFNDVKDSEMNNIHYEPLLRHVNLLPSKLVSPKK